MSRARIPANVSSALLLANRHSCCVCQGRGVQIHHIDEDPSNNDISNLAALCLPCHDQASMQIGLTKKLRANEVREYKAQWEAKCAADMEALSKDRTRFYATVYKNPPRVRELLSGLRTEDREAAALAVLKQIEADSAAQQNDEGFNWQANPKDDTLTRALLMSVHLGEIWPRCLERVSGHPNDPDYPADLSPPNGMRAFHGYDLYCQLIVRALCVVRPPIALEALWSLKDPGLIDHFAGRLVSFRETAIGKSVVSPKQSDDVPLGRVQFRVARGGITYKALLSIKNMYVFSDTAAINLQRSKICGIAILEDAQEFASGGKTEIRIGLKPLIIGIGGLGQSEQGFWDIPRGVNGSTAL